MAVLQILVLQLNKLLFITNFVNMSYLLLALIEILHRNKKLSLETLLQEAQLVHRQVTIILLSGEIKVIFSRSHSL